MTNKSKHEPIHPGEILATEFLEPLELSQSALARAMGVPPRRVNEIVPGQANHHTRHGCAVRKSLRHERAVLAQPPERLRPRKTGGRYGRDTYDSIETLQHVVA